MCTCLFVRRIVYAKSGEISKVANKRKINTYAMYMCTSVLYVQHIYQYNITTTTKNFNNNSNYYLIKLKTTLATYLNWLSSVSILF